jgi:transcriptional regulator with XRE-family HTH domain
MAWFARATHYSREHLYRLKRGDAPISDAFARAAAAALDLPISDLFLPVESPVVRITRTEDG